MENKKCVSVFFNNSNSAEEDSSVWDDTLIHHCIAVDQFDPYYDELLVQQCICVENR